MRHSVNKRRQQKEQGGRRLDKILEREVSKYGVIIK